ncbi:DUF1648 domain-containing protein [Mycoplasmatota bacterium WC44]
MKIIKYILLSIMILTFVFTIIIYPSLPDQIPMHWNMNGVVDRYGDKSSVFILLAMAAFVYMLFPLLKKIDPKRANYEKFKNEYQIMRYSITVVLLIAYVLSILASFGKIDVGIILPIVIGVLFMVIGNYMSRVRQSFFIGIKTPWTLSSETVWNKTHRLGGYVFVIGGLLFFLAGVIQNTLFIMITNGLFSIGIIYTIYYSYKIYREEKNE